MTIIGIVGGVGSGKSAYATHKIVQCGKTCFVNYDIKCDNTLRLKKEDIINEHITEYSKTGIPKKELKINWDFWNKALDKYGSYNLFLDEFHNIAHSRKSQTTWNTLLSIWGSQIRKVLGGERGNLYLVSQRLRRIDSSFRDLMHELVYCRKYQTLPYVDTMVCEKGKRFMKKVPKTYILAHYFYGENLENDYQNFIYGGKGKTFKRRTMIYINPIFKFYDSYQLFGETAYL